MALLDIEAWDRDGFSVLPGYLSADELAPGRAELPLLFPTGAEFHDRVDEERNARFRDEFAGITKFPFASTQLSLLAVHARLIELAAQLLRTDDLRVYGIEAWAKYTGAADYDQDHHRDYLGHTMLVPAAAERARQVEMFVYLCDVPVELGPPSFVPMSVTAQMPALPNWYPRGDGGFDPEQPRWVAPTGRPDLYDAEVSGAGPAGTVAAYRVETFHRGTALTAPRGVRYTIHINFRRADAEWLTRRSWTDSVRTSAWQEFVEHSSPRQLALFGVPPAGHDYWTAETLTGMALRYPGLDLSPWER